jgi:hypothetical protein
LFDDGDRRWPNKHPLAHIALKVAFSLDTTIILATIIVQLDSHPVPGSEMRLTYIANRRQTAVGELDNLANLKLLKHDVQLIEGTSLWI